ncbi:hypothetical protein [Streptomyces formicae]|uniref:Yip1 domain-containing protein n=1 Tax=Streptomyces formicae TaxID=1616117 RepID=A0ABY3WTN3_9ACTN|nr:hypothetical protein [Streptomyces formicae]UNM16018.1 hypothetical protein J4032_35200 [Streptomyces formicae]
MAVPVKILEPADSESGAGTKPRKVRRPGPTSRVFWLIAYGLTIAAILLRLPTLHETVRRQLQDSDMAGKVEDRSMEALAVNIGLLLAVFLSMLLLAVFYSLAAVVERNVLTMRRQAGRERGFGLGFVIALLCTFPVHLVSSVLGVSSPKTTGWYYLYVLLVAVIAPIFFRAHWIGLDRRKIITTYAFAVGLAGFSLAI